MTLTAQSRIRVLVSELAETRRELRDALALIQELWAVSQGHRNTAPVSARASVSRLLRRAARAVRREWGANHESVATQLDELAKAKERTW